MVGAWVSERPFEGCCTLRQCRAADPSAGYLFRYPHVYLNGRLYAHCDHFGGGRQSAQQVGLFDVGGEPARRCRDRAAGRVQAVGRMLGVCLDGDLGLNHVDVQTGWVGASASQRGHRQRWRCCDGIRVKLSVVGSPLPGAVAVAGSKTSHRH